MTSIPPVLARVPARALIHAWRASIDGNSNAVNSARLRLEAEYPGRAALLVDSGTSALAIALRMSGVTSDSIVALPAYACPDIATAAQTVGARIALYDLDPDTLAPDLDGVKRCIEGGASAVVVCHFFGSIVDVARVTSLCEPLGVHVIEDAAQHAGGRWLGTRAGALTGIGILSFGRGKGLSASGGGAVLFDARRYAASKISLSVAKQSAAPGLMSLAEQRLSHPLIYGMIAALPIGLGETRYFPPHAETPLSAFRSSLLISALNAEGAELTDRRAKAAIYRRLLSNMRGVQLVPATPSAEEGALRVAVRLAQPASSRAQRLGVVRSYPRGLWEYPEIVPSLVTTSAQDWPGARMLAQTLWTLPTHWRVTQSIQQQIVAQLG